VGPTVALSRVSTKDEALKFLGSFDSKKPLKLILVTGDSRDRMTLVEAVRAHPHLCDTPVVLMSEDTSAASVHLALGHGANSYVAVPESAGEREETLRDTLHFWLNTNVISAKKKERG
jgi:PleD family two-component response regulator